MCKYHSFILLFVALSLNVAIVIVYFLHQAFQASFEPVSDPFERLAHISRSLSFLDNTSPGADRRDANLRVSESMAESVMTDDISGGGIELRGRVSEKGQSLNRDTMMHPTKPWTERCEHFTKIYSTLLKQGSSGKVRGW